MQGSVDFQIVVHYLRTAVILEHLLVDQLINGNTLVIILQQFK